MALRRLEIDESRDIAKYGEQLKELGDAGSIAILNHVIEDERDHYQELGSLLRGHYPVSANSPTLDITPALKHDRERTLDGRRRLPRSQKRARDLRRRGCARTRSHPDEWP